MDAAATEPDTTASSRVTIWDLAIPLLGGGAAFIASGIGVAIMRRLHPAAINIASLPRNFWYLHIFALLLYAAVLVFVVWRVRRKQGGLIAGLTPVPAGTLLGGAVSGSTFALLFMATIGVLMSTHLIEFHPTSAELALTPHTPPQMALALLSVAVFAPLAEEMYFRGLLLTWLDGKLGVIAAATISAVIFGVFHFRFRSHIGAEGLVLTAVLILFGAMNAVWAIRTRSLWPSILAHGFYNGTLMLLPFLGKH